MSGPDAGDRYIARNLQASCVTAFFVVMVLWSYGQTGAIAPYLAGFVLAVVLLYLMEGFIRRVFAPEHLGIDNRDAEKKKRSGRRGAAWFLGFGMLKYPLLALLIWYLVRIWSATQLMIFAGGFLTLHLVIGLRAVGAVVTQKGRS